MFTRYWAEVIAKRLGTEVSEDAKRVDEVLDGLNHTKGYCPCVPKYAHCKAMRCPCVGMRIDGHCHCELFKNKKGS